MVADFDEIGSHHVLTMWLCQHQTLLQTTALLVARLRVEIQAVDKNKFRIHSRSLALSKDWRCTFPSSKFPSIMQQIQLRGIRTATMQDKDKKKTKVTSSDRRWRQKNMYREEKHEILKSKDNWFSHQKD